MTNDVQYAGFWRRFAAFLVDSVFATLVLQVLAIVAIGNGDVVALDPMDPDALQAALDILATRLPIDIAIVGVLFVVLWSVRSATPGKMLLDCSIVDATTFGPASNVQNVVRYFGYFVSMLPLFLGFFWVGWDRRKQGWHDKIARTVVIRGRPRDAGATRAD